METRLVNTQPSGRVHLSLAECRWLQAKVGAKHGGKLPSYYVTMAKRDVPTGKQLCSYCAK